MATTLLTPQERGQAQAALNRLAAAGHVNGRFQQVRPAVTQENSAFKARTDVHDGPGGHGRTVIVETRKGNILVRKAQGEGPNSATYDWEEIDLTKLSGFH